jgi:DNA polymerase I-like protein with 3'-5' exonuclease and polymerase domains
LSVTAGCTYEEAKAFMEKFDRGMPRLKRWLDGVGAAGRKDMQIRSMAGYRRFFTRPNREELTEDEFRKEMAAIEREARNFPVQGPNALWMKQVMAELPPLIHPLGFHLCHTVHDEVALRGHEWFAEEAAAITRKKMIEVGERWLCETKDKKAVRVDAEATIAKYWAKG